MSSAAAELGDYTPFFAKNASNDSPADFLPSASSLLRFRLAPLFGLVDRGSGCAGAVMPRQASTCRLTSTLSIAPRDAQHTGHIASASGLGATDVDALLLPARKFKSGAACLFAFSSSTSIPSLMPIRRSFAGSISFRSGYALSNMSWTELMYLLDGVIPRARTAHPLAQGCRLLGDGKLRRLRFHSEMPTHCLVARHVAAEDLAELYNKLSDCCAHSDNAPASMCRPAAAPASNPGKCAPH